MKKILSLLVLGHFLNPSLAQTFTNTTGGSITDDNVYNYYPIPVSGLPTSMNTTSFGLDYVKINVTHPNDGDLRMKLQSPDGTIYQLTSFYGDSGDNYTNTYFDDTASTMVAGGTAPFSGTFKPIDALANFNNGANPNGTWNLMIRDQTTGNTGNVNSWSITFSSQPSGYLNFTSSNLPIVVINTGGVAIPDEPKIDGFMGIIYNGPGVRNFTSNPYNNYKNKIAIERRGSTSGGFPQKSYGFETHTSIGLNNDTTLLGIPAEHDWILNGPYDDKTCIRNVLSYDIATQTGHYAPKTRYCEMVLNGQYQGIYILMEKIKRDSNRVDIAKLTSADTAGDDLTGGYIIKIDKTTGSATSDGWNSGFPSPTGSAISFLYDYPDATTIAPQQKNYIHSYVDSFEVALAGGNFTLPLVGYRRFAKVNTFIDYFILNEVSRNVDGYRLSTYLHKDKQSKGGKLAMGPAWDYNLAWWNADYCSGADTAGWAYQFANVCAGDSWQVPFWWGRLLEDPSYTAALKCRWTELRQNTLSISTLDHFIDSLSGYLYEAQARHFTEWPILGVYTWPNPSPLPNSYLDEVATMKSWIHARIAWLDANMPGTCTVGIAESALTSNNVMVYPNPFADQIQVDLYLSNPEKIKVELYSVLGSKIMEMPEKEYTSGLQSIQLNIGNDVPEGIYLLRIRSGNQMITKKITKAN